MNRITDILKDEESLRQLSELADMLRSGELAEEHEETKSVDNSGNMPDMDMKLYYISFPSTFLSLKKKHFFN